MCITGRRALAVALTLPILWLTAPNHPRIPVRAASRADWNPATFWHERWGRSGVHKGIDIFARKAPR